MKLKTAIDIFVNEKEIFQSDVTVKHYIDNFRYFTRYLESIGVDDMEVEDFTAKDYNAYIRYLRNKDVQYGFMANGDTKPRKMAKRTILTYSRVIKTLFKWLYMEEYIENDISQRMKLIKEERKMLVPIFKDEVEKIDKTFNLKCKTGLMQWIVVHLMLDCGLRISEVINLQIHDINFKNRYIMIRQSKGDKDRIVPMPASMKANLYNYLYLYRDYANHDYALQNKHNLQLSYQGCKSFIDRLRRKLEIPRLRCHLLRHTFATSYIMGGGDISSLRIYMGHSDITTTDKYLHIANTYKLMGNDNYYKLDRIYYKRLY